MVDLLTVPMGKLPAKHDPRTLRLARYLTPDLPPPPASQDWTGAVPSWPMLGNDTIGDCTCAAAAHLEQGWSANAAPPGTCPTVDQVLAMYSAISGYDPSRPDSDRGAFLLDALKFWRSTGLGGHQIESFVSVNPLDHVELEQACQLFGGVYLGLSLPISAQSQDVWDASPDDRVSGDWAPGSWGGHAVSLHGYDAEGVTIITWGQRKRCTWAFLEHYCDEAYAVLSPDWISSTGVAPCGIEWGTLRADLAVLSGSPAPEAPSYRCVEAPFPGPGCDTTLRFDASKAAAIKAAGMRYVMRYLGSLTQAELATLTAAGLLVSPICYPPQHTGWIPTAADGTARGKAAVVQAQAVGVPSGVTIWIDLEGCHGPASSTKDWCEAFGHELVEAGYTAGLYVGAAPGGLDSAGLYALKHITRYWQSCSRGIPEPSVRGWCLKQHYRPNVTVAGILVDADSVCVDFLGCLPTMIAA